MGGFVYGKYLEWQILGMTLIWDDTNYMKESIRMYTIHNIRVKMVFEGIFVSLKFIYSKKDTQRLKNPPIWIWPTDWVGMFVST